MKFEGQNISKVVESNQCVSCGLCAAVCPKKCIRFEKNNKTYIPSIKEEECIQCGVCDDICPGNQFDYNREYIETGEPDNFWLGQYRKILSMQAADQVILQKATSGGVVTQIVKELLDRKEYDCAFLVDTFEYKQQVQTKKYENADEILKTAKSRYVPVSQQNAVSYALEHQDKRIIFVGTSCFVHGLINVIKRFRLNRSNYLILGLFCDRTMNYGIYYYFSQHPKCKGQLEQLYFRTKEAGGWPGNVRLIYDNGAYADLSASQRMMVKDYFQLERCLYCLDKLNQFADLSIGDDYSISKSDKSGRSAVVVRTEKGEKIVSELIEYFNFFDVSEEKLIKAQKPYLREKNLSFIGQKGLKAKVPGKVMSGLNKQERERINEYSEHIARIKMGAQYNYKQITSAIPVRVRINYKIKDFVRSIPP